jgi:hypothetical protein
VVGRYAAAHQCPLIELGHGRWVARSHDNVRDICNADLCMCVTQKRQHGRSPSPVSTPLCTGCALSRLVAGQEPAPPYKLGMLAVDEWDTYTDAQQAGVCNQLHAVELVSVSMHACVWGYACTGQRVRTGGKRLLAELRQRAGPLLRGERAPGCTPDRATSLCDSDLCRRVDAWMQAVKALCRAAEAAVDARAHSTVTSRLHMLDSCVGGHVERAQSRGQRLLEELSAHARGLTLDPPLYAIDRDLASWCHQLGLYERVDAWTADVQALCRTAKAVAHARARAEAAVKRADAQAQPATQHDIDAGVTEGAPDERGVAQRSGAGSEGRACGDRPLATPSAAGLSATAYTPAPRESSSQTGGAPAAASSAPAARDQAAEDVRARAGAADTPLDGEAQNGRVEGAPACTAIEAGVTESASDARSVALHGSSGSDGRAGGETPVAAVAAPRGAFTFAHCIAATAACVTAAAAASVGYVTAAAAAAATGSPASCSFTAVAPAGPSTCAAGKRKRRGKQQGRKRGKQDSDGGGGKKVQRMGTFGGGRKPRNSAEMCAKVCAPRPRVHACTVRHDRWLCQSKNA